MKVEEWWNIRRTVALLALAAVAGALAGAAAALVVTPVQVTESSLSMATSTFIGATTTRAEPALIKLEPQLAVPLLPPEFAARRSSPVAALYRKPKGTSPEERTLSDERLLGQAVVMTSDGWFVTAASVIGQLRLGELTLWHNGKNYALERGVLDGINDTVFIKVSAADLTAPAFGDVVDLIAGSEMWLEKRGGAFSPSLVVSLSDNVPATETASSEQAARRIRLHGTTAVGDNGAPAWNAKGALVGIIDSSTNEPLRIIPVSSLSASLSSLLQTGGIRHAALGVRAVDLSAWRIDGDRGTLPPRGALLRDDRKSSKPAIVKDSAAAKASLKAGDVILSVERDILDGKADLGEILSEYRPDTEVSLRLNRKGEELDVKLKLGSVITSEVLK